MRSPFGWRSKNKKKSRSRRIIWFNVSCQWKLTLVPYFWNYYFDYNHPLDQFFNISTIKVSYCTLSSIKDHIAKHNTKVYNNSSKTTDERKCDCTCKFKNNCPLKGNCQQKSVVYQAHVNTTKNTMTYTGMTRHGTVRRVSSRQ